MVFPIPFAVGRNVQFGTVGIFDHDLPCMQARVSANQVVSLIDAAARADDISFKLNAILTLDKLAVLSTFMVPIAPLYDFLHLFQGG
jgi:hypothetical protein